MRNPQVFNCDVCGIAKGETNHWRVLRVWSPMKAVTFSRSGSLAIYGWDDKASCTQKLVERWLELGTLEPKRVAGGAA
jgi:hypothetical protein